MTNFEEKLNSLLSDPEAMGQIIQLARSLGGSFDGSQFAPFPPEPPQQPSPPVNNLFSGIDPGAVIRLLPLVQELGEQNKNARALLLALRPYLKPERQDKVEQALQLARLICVGKKFFLNQGE